LRLQSSPRLRAKHFWRALLLASLVAVCTWVANVAVAQPGRFAPGSSSFTPSAPPRPGVGGQPQPYGARPYRDPDPNPTPYGHRQGQYRQPGAPGAQSSLGWGGNETGVGQPNPYGSQPFGGQPAIPSAIRGPVFHNPFALHSESPAQFDPVQAAHVRLPAAGPTEAGWEEVQRLAATGNVAQLQQQINQRLAGDRSLDGLMTAVSAMERANAAPRTANPYRSQALALAEQQIRAGTQQPLPYLAKARFALEDRNDALFRQTTREMVQRFPNNPQAQYFEGVRAVKDGDWRSAEKALRKARDLGMNDDSLAQLLKVAIDHQRWIWQYAKISSVLVILWLVGLVAIVFIGRFLSKRTLRAIREGGQLSQTAADRWTRSAYRAVVFLASLNYFLSLPLMLALSIALPLALSYALLMTPFLNLWLVAFVLIGGLGGVLTAISGLRTAFVKIPEASIGRSLSLGEAPNFWEFVRAVARDAGTRPVDAIWVTPGVDMAVLERGSWRQKLNDTGERVLLMGVAVLPGLRIDAARAVLAHEYAHFIHRDTAGGDLALRVQVAMNRFINAIVSRGPVRWWDVTAQFLRFYVPLYHRLTLGATRMQEVLADRVAVERYGSSAVVDGFHHIVRRQIEFQHLTSKAVSDAIRGTAATAAFYAPAKAITGHDRLDLEAEVRDALQHPTTDFDSHPGMMERIVLARRVGVDRPLGEGVVLSLFGEMVKQLARDMAQLIMDDVKSQAGLLKQHYAEALRKTERAIGVQATVELLEARATIYYRQGEVQKALEDLNRILAHWPGDAKTLLSRANVYESEREYAKAIEDLRRLKTRGNELPRDLRLQVQLQLATDLLRLGQMEKAASEFEEALSLAPNSLNAVLGRLQAAAALKTLGDECEQALLKRAITTWPDMAALDPLAVAGGLAKLLVAERKRHALRAPAAAVHIDSPPSYGRWLMASGIGSGAIAAAICGLLWWNTSSSESGEVSISTVDQPPAAKARTEPAVTTPAVPAPAVAPAQEQKVPSTSVVSTAETKSQPNNPDATANVVPAPAAEPAPVTTPTTQPATASADPATKPPTAPDANTSTPPPTQIAIATPPHQRGHFGRAAQPDPPPQPVPEVKPVPVAPVRSVRIQAPRKEVTFVHIPSVKPRALHHPPKVASNNTDSVEARLKRIALAMHQYYDVNRCFPVKPDRKFLDASHHPYLSWRVHLLPFLDERPLYAQFKLDEPWDSPQNRELLRHMPDIYRSSPRDKEETRFATPIADGTLFGGERPPMMQQITDGVSNTVLVVQTATNQAIPWTKPDDLPVDLEHPRRAWGRTTPRSIFCVLADATTLQLPANAPDDLIAALLTGHGHEVLDAGTVRRYAAYQRGEMFVAPERAYDHEQRMLKEIGIALMNYESVRKQFPAAGPLTEQPTGRGSQLSWRVHVLPFIEHGALYDQFHLDEPWDSPHNRKLAEFMPDVYRDADDPVDSVTTRIMVMTGPGTPFVDRRRGPNRKQFRDGPSNTILALQAGEDRTVLWTRPDDLPFDPARPLAKVGKIDPRVGLLVLMADGAVRTLSPGTDDANFAKLVTPAGGEVIDRE
jgi:tetratricopeptide (TPR) repeat protein/Zn-dependent protease with chaperone function